MKLNEYTNMFGKWKATKRTNGVRPLDWETIEEFDFRPGDAIELKKQELAQKYNISPDDIYMYNTEDEEVEEGVLHKINGGKRRVRRKVNVSQRD